MKMPAKLSGSSSVCSVAASLWTPNNSRRAFSDRKAQTLFRLQLVSSACTTKELASRVQSTSKESASACYLVVPVPCHLMQQGVGLGLAVLEILEEVQHQTDFVEGQADDVDEVSKGDHDLQGERATSQHAGDLALLVVGAAKNAIGNQHSAALFQS